MTTMKKEIKHCINRCCGDGEKYFILEMEYLAANRPGIFYLNGEKHMFKVPLGLSSVTSINLKETNSFTINITVDILQELYLTMGLDENGPLVREISTESIKMAISLYIS